MDIQMAEVTEIVEAKVKVKFNQDDVPSELEYPKLISYSPKVGDKVLMLRTNTSYICLGGIGADAEDQKEEIDPCFVGEYKYFADDRGLFWKGWAKCDGRELDPNTYPELFDIIGISFSGDNKFRLPFAQGRVLSDATGELHGATAGSKSVTLTTNQIPKHKHDLTVSNSDFTTGSWQYAKLASFSSTGNASMAIKETGGGQSHENRQPTLYGGYHYIYTGVK